MTNVQERTLRAYPVLWFSPAHLDLPGKVRSTCPGMLSRGDSYYEGMLARVCYAIQGKTLL